MLNVLFERWDVGSARWVSHASRNIYTPFGYLEPGQTSLRFADWPEQTGPGIFRVSYFIRWFNTGTGQMLGWKVVTLMSSSDYGCRPTVYSCQVGPGWIRL